MRPIFVVMLLGLQSLVFAKDTTRSLELPYLSTFEYTGPGRVEILQGKGNHFQIKGPEDIIRNFVVSYSEETLSVKPKGLTDVSTFTSIPHITLIVNQLQKLLLDGDAYVDIDSLHTDNLMIELQKNGSTLLEGHIDCHRLGLSILGSSQAQLRGKADSQTVYINGSGLYDGKGLVTREANVRLIGANSALVNVTDQLSISIRGSGHVHYVGSPEIHKKIAGDGLVSPLTEQIIEQFEEKK